MLTETPIALQQLAAGLLAGTIRATPYTDPKEVWAGDVVYRCSNGWQLTVFNDCGTWDYVSHFITPSGETISWEDPDVGIFIHPVLSNMLLEEPHASRIFGSPA